LQPGVTTSISGTPEIIQIKAHNNLTVSFLEVFSLLILQIRVKMLANVVREQIISSLGQIYCFS